MSWTPRDTEGNARAEWDYRHRVYLGQVRSVQPEDGTVDVYVRDLREVRRAVIPVLALSYTGTEGVNGSSWFRYMPDVGALVKLAYGPRNELELLGYASYGLLEGEGEGADSPTAAALGGLRSLGKLAARGEGGLNRWRLLKPGEFEFRSSGGASLFLGADGTAALEGRGVGLRLDGSRNGVEWAARDFVGFVGDGYELRVGAVKRAAAVPVPPLAMVDAVIAPNPTSAPVPSEARLVAGALLPGTPAPSMLYELHAGDLRDALGLPLTGHAGSPPRLRERLIGPAGVDLPANEVLIKEVDVLGNVALRHGPAAAPTAGVSVSMPLAAVNTAFAQAVHTTTGPTTLAASALQLGSPAATLGVQLGPPTVALLNRIVGELIKVNAALLATVTKLGAIPMTAELGAIAPVLAGNPTAIAETLAAIQAQLGGAPGTLYSTKVVSDA